VKQLQKILEKTNLQGSRNKVYGASDEFWKVKRDNETQRFDKIQQDSENMELFDA
jgi:DNA-binding transcriptional regulator GbsR (MarR family)